MPPTFAWAYMYEAVPALARHQVWGAEHLTDDVRLEATVLNILRFKHAGICFKG